MKKRLTLQKKERLKSRKQIEHLFSKGKSFSVSPYRIVYSFENAVDLPHEPGLKCGFTVSSRFFKKATDRNRIKRITREAYRVQKNILEDKLLLRQKALNMFILYTGKELPDFAMAKEKLGLILNKLMQQPDEKNTSAA
ncbi:MAG: ribonuclease P protein component [Chitinophagaceae bacterium]|nr:ribonuclease P protein component [Chitinophagaceae bacterium]